MQAKKRWHFRFFFYAAHYHSLSMIGLTEEERNMKTGRNQRMAPITLVALCLGLVSVTQNARADVIIFDHFSDLSGWTAFRASTAFDFGRTVVVPDQLSASNMEIQHAITPIDMFGASAPESIFTRVILRRNSGGAGDIIRAQWVNTGSTSAGDFFYFQATYRASDGNLQFFEQLDGSTANLYNAPISAFPFNDLTTDYGVMEIHWLTASREWQVITDIGGTKTTEFTVASHATGGSFHRADLVISNQTTGEPDFLVDLYRLDTVEAVILEATFTDVEVLDTRALEFDTDPGMLYRLDSAATPAGPFDDLGITVDGDGGTKRVFDPTELTGFSTGRVYRIRILAP